MGGEPSVPDAGEKGQALREKNMKRIRNKSSVQGIAVSPAYYLGKAVWSIARFFFLLGMTFIILYPIMYMLSMALRESVDMYDSSVVWIPRHFTLENFKLLFTSLDFLPALKNSAIITIVCTLLQTLICAMTGYGFAMYKFKGRKLLLAVVIFTIIVPPQMVNLPNYLLFSDFDIFGILHAVTGAEKTFSMLDKYYAVFLLAALGQGIRSGLFILIFYQYFRSVPKELQEAAMLDGCGEFHLFSKIMLRNASGPIITTTIFSAVWYWNDYYTMTTFFINIRTVSTKLTGLTSSLTALMGNDAYNPYKIMTIQQAACFTVLLPALILFIVLQRRFSRSVLTSGLVG